MTEKDHKALSRLIMYDKIKHYYGAQTKLQDHQELLGDEPEGVVTQWV